jgi:hypothetical protein
MTDEGKKGQHAGQPGQSGGGHQGGARADVNDALLDVFKELVSRLGQTPQQARPLSTEAADVVARFQEFKDDFNMVSAIKDDSKQRQQKGG